MVEKAGPCLDMMLGEFPVVEGYDNCTIYDTYLHQEIQRHHYQISSSSHALRALFMVSTRRPTGSGFHVRREVRLTGQAATSRSSAGGGRRKSLDHGTSLEGLGPDRDPDAHPKDLLRSLTPCRIQHVPLVAYFNLGAPLLSQQAILTSFV